MPTIAQLRTLGLLVKEPARRHQNSPSQSDYTWVHKDADKPITQNMHALFLKGWAEVTENDSFTAVITQKGRAVTCSYIG